MRFCAYAFDAAGRKTFARNSWQPSSKNADELRNMDYLEVAVLEGAETKAL